MFANLVRCLTRLPGQLLGRNPFRGDCLPSRVKLIHFGSGRGTFPFPHPWNYDRPIEILESYFWNSENETGGGQHNRFLDVPGFAPILVTRDPQIIRAITTETGDKPGQFDRDTLPSTGIARATGNDTLLYSNGAIWKSQRKLAASPFGKTTLFQPEMFHEFAETFRHTVLKRLEVLRQHLLSSGEKSVRIPLEPEIKAVMLEMLTNSFFGTTLSYDEIRNCYVPGLERVIEHIVGDTVKNKLGIPVWKLPSLTRGMAQTKRDFACFEALTDHVLAARNEGKGLWKQFKSDVPNEALRSNLKVFLAGALEATTSYASWAVAHLARHPAAQEKVWEEVKSLEDYSPEHLDAAKYLGRVLDETLRLTPSLYFLPRQATVDTWVDTADGRKMFIPQGTHVLLDVWHANRHEDHWGTAVAGYPAVDFAPERWEHLAAAGRASKDVLHFGFGHGPRVCPGKHLGQLEVALVVGALLKMFRLRSPVAEYRVKAGVSTKPLDGTLVDLELR
ncbi:putative bifunctional P-450 [Anatilimnocola aggregata]|uniref:Putative bifunctional P-450 n=1 Tax=Anatilimnocola aggregata TaxID=2528021 RepID=A0A517YAT2_9BACT|nr:cytochrome P450 [Anatilimnocola aggregata]QDU27345.1 putative bifunctional P-450 [Anatilimnocola aggregata]